MLASLYDSQTSTDSQPSDIKEREKNDPPRFFQLDSISILLLVYYTQQKATP